MIFQKHANPHSKSRSANQYQLGAYCSSNYRFQLKGKFSQSKSCLDILVPICKKKEFTRLDNKINKVFRLLAENLKYRPNIQTIILKSMCLFFGHVLQNCKHAQCQILRTIKSLNQQSLFTKPPACLSHIPTQIQLQNEEKLDLAEDQPILDAFKLETSSLSHEVTVAECESQQERIKKLQQQVQELRQVAYWMKGQLQLKGLLD